MNRIILTTKDEFKEYCLRSLGKGVINIEVSDEQIEDRISDAIQFAQEFIYEGSYNNYLTYSITQTDRDNKFINIPEEVLSIKNIWFNTSFIGSILNNTFKLASISMINNINAPTNTISNFYFAKLNIATLNKVLNAHAPFRFNYSTGKLYLDMDWDSNFALDDKIMLDCYTAIDPENSERLWNNIFLKRYAIALIQKQWAQNISKFVGISLPGNTTLNADKMLDQAEKELEKIKEELINFEGPLVPILA